MTKQLRIAMALAIGFAIAAALLCVQQQRLNEVSRVVDVALGQKWAPLTKEQQKNLSEAVKTLEKRPVTVMYRNELGHALADSFADVFRGAGWDVGEGEGTQIGTGIGTGRGNGFALTLKKAIEDATSLKLTSYGPTEADNPANVFIAIGMNRKD